MDTQPNREQLEEALQKILNDDDFRKSARSVHLLSFLFEKAIQSIDVSEFMVGEELFKNNYNYENSDSRVRVYMHYLRKKLKEYYNKGEVKDVIQFEIKKGQYNLSFSKVKQNTANETPVAVNTPKQKYLFVAISLVVGLMVGFLLSRTNLPKQNYCWNTFFEENATNTVVLANQLVMRKLGKPHGWLYTNRDVNSSSDFIAFSKKNGTDSLLLTDYSFYTKAIPYSLINLTELFTQNKAKLNPQPESEFKYDVIKRGNIIYLGQQKTMSLSKEIFLKNSRIFKYKTDVFICTRENKKNIYKSKFGKSICLEYAMVSYMPLINGHKALYFVSNNDIGVMATIDKFTNREQLEQFYEKLPRNDSYFNALFQVEGLNRFDVSCKLVELEIIQ